MPHFDHFPRPGEIDSYIYTWALLYVYVYCRLYWTKKQWEVTLDRSNSAQIDLIKYQLRSTNKYFTFTKNHKEFPLTLNKINIITGMREKLIQSIKKNWQTAGLVDIWQYNPCFQFVPSRKVRNRLIEFSPHGFKTLKTLILLLSP